MNVTIAKNGIEAIDLLSGAHPFDIVLMDIQMPEMSGHEATTYIRKELKLTDLPIIGLTAHAMAEEKQRCIDSGMNDFITKPVDPDLLYELLERYLEI